MLRLGYKASTEQFGPRELLRFGVFAEEQGLDLVAVSDHFQPWRHSTGRAPSSLVWLGALAVCTERVWIGTSVLTPTLRYHPAVVAQAFGTLGALAPGRVFLGLGTGEALNEKPATGLEWPAFRERFDRLVEAIELKRLLWAEERVTYRGRYYRTDRATVYERPEHPVPIYVGAAAAQTARLAGRLADGFICTSGKERELYLKLLDAVAEGARAEGRDPAAIERMIEIKVSYDHDLAAAREACRWWAALSLSPQEKQGIEDPVELERLADANAERAADRFIVSADAEEAAARIGEYVALGFMTLVFHAPGHDQERFLRLFCADVVPILRERYGATVRV